MATTTRMGMPALLLLLLALLALAAVPPSVRAQPLPPCNSTLPPLPRSSQINIALLIWGPASPHPLSSLEAWGSASPLTRFGGATATDAAVLRAWALWTEGMTPAGESMPQMRMRDGEILRINVSYFSVAPFGSLWDNDEFGSSYDNSTTLRLINHLADPQGKYGRMHFILPPYGHTVVALLVSLACERTRSCITIGTSMPNSRQFICGDPLGQMPMQRDCASRGRRTGERRFEYMVASASNGDYWGSGSLALAVNQNVKRVAVFGETWTEQIVRQLFNTGKQLGIDGQIEEHNTHNTITHEGSRSRLG